jgi:hypothetical protein
MSGGKGNDQLPVNSLWWTGRRSKAAVRQVSEFVDPAVAALNTCAILRRNAMLAQDTAMGQP